MQPKRIKKVMATPINVIFSHLQKKNRVRIWLFEDTRMQIEGQIIGFDEYMNFVLDDAVEIDTRKSQRQSVGRILLKGDAITLIQEAQPVRPVQQEQAQEQTVAGDKAGDE